MSRKLLVLLTLLLLITPFASLYAQTPTEGIDYCRTLSEADCEILTRSTEVMSAVESFAFDMSLVYDIAMGGEMSGMDNIVLDLSGSGSMALDVALMMQMQDMAMIDPTNYMQQVPELFDTFLASLEGEAHLVFTLPDMLSMSMPNEASEIPLNLLMQNGQFLVDVGAIEAATGEGSGEPQWMGIDMTGAFATMMGQMMEDFDMSELVDPAMMEKNVEFANNLITMNRLEDIDMNGESVAVFEMVFDYGAFLEDQEMRDYITSMYEDMGMEQEMIDGILGMLSEINIIFHEHIGLETFYTYHLDMTMDFEIDGETFGDPSMDSMSFGFDFAFDLSDFNTPIDVQIPEDANVFPFEALMGGMGM